jgi:hypothetical protein
MDLGDVLGRLLNVGITFLPSLGAFFTHFMTAVWWYPKCLATLRMLHPFRTSLTASRLTAGSLGLLLYAIFRLAYISQWCQAIEPLREY